MAPLITKYGTAHPSEAEEEERTVKDATGLSPKLIYPTKQCPSDTMVAFKLCKKAVLFGAQVLSPRFKGS